MDDTYDPYRLRSLDIGRLRAKGGRKWQLPETPYAAWIADMDFDLAPPIADALRGLVDRGELGYPDWRDTVSPAAGLFPARQSARYGWEPRPDRLHDLCDVIQGVRVAVRHLSAPGDGVVLHLPAYHPFLHTIDEMDRRLVHVDWTGEGFDYDDLERRLSARPARMWILCNPHNPLGRVFPREELERIAGIAARHDLVVIADEIHADLTLPGHAHVAFESLGDDVSRRTITITSASKAFNLAGLRWAVLHAGHEPMQHALESLPGHYLGMPNVMAVAATVAAWTEGDDWLAAVVAVIDENRRRLPELLAERLTGARCTPLEATYLAWIDCRALGLGDDPAAAFRDRGAALSPGHQFSPLGHGIGHARLNIATSPAILAATVRAMAG